MNILLSSVQRTAANIDEWRKQAGIGDAVRLDNQDDQDIDDDQVQIQIFI